MITGEMLQARHDQLVAQHADLVTQIGRIEGALMLCERLIEEAEPSHLTHPSTLEVLSVEPLTEAAL